DEPGEAVARLLLHEFQHMKLGAILDLFDLHDGSDTDAAYKVAWRVDPRPLESAMQGVYAHLAVALYWERRAEATTDPAASDYLRHAALYASWVDDAVRRISHSRALTPLGRRWLERLRSALPQHPNTAFG